MSDPTLYLYTSLTAGSSHIVTATARLETILKANKLPFRAIDVATDDAARKLWGRRSKGKKLPGLVKYGTVVGDLEQIEEWNEYGELRMEINNVEDFDGFPAEAATTTTTSTSTPTPTDAPAPKQSTIKIQNPPAKETQKDDSITVALRQAGEEAASKAKENARGEAKPETASSAELPSPPTATSAAAAGTASEEKAEAPVRRPSVAPEIAERPRRPPLIVPECAAVSSANIRADNAAALGLIEHHRGSIVSATSPEEKRKVAQDLRKSISESRSEFLQSLKEDPRKHGGEEEPIVEEEPTKEEPSIVEEPVGVMEHIFPGADTTEKQS
ncbi:hypothetical protein FE257_010954 [Aspergillus nanangensis]|uniref:Uncharacterized protein n=1 Tax=Aspergillus nanangensis TaxID=2582783 RepID=A0AAD4CXR0_ASPNN|nr:hypothetical protein FE257_010954 [Aspergillus nanangensis]